MHFEFYPMLLVIIILESALNSLKTIMCFEISSESNPHYDIISFSWELKANWQFRYQLALIPVLPEKLMEEDNNYFSFLSNDNSFQNCGNLMVINTANSFSELILMLKQIEKFYKYKATRYPYFFIQIQLETSSEILTQSYFENTTLEIPPTSDVYLISKSNDVNVSWYITELYWIKNHPVIQSIRSKSTLHNDNIDFTTILKRTSRRSNFQSVEILGVGVDVKGYELGTDYDDDSPIPKFVKGYEVSVYWFLRDALNFTEVAVNGTGFVREGPNHTLQGMAIQVNRGEADLSISSNEYLEYRVSGPDGISFVHSTFHAEMVAYFKQPPASSIRDIFVSAFTFQLWIILFVIWIFIGLILSIAYKIYFKYFDYIDPKDLLMSQEIQIWVVGALCQQGWYFTPVAFGARIIFFSGWLVGLLCYVAFSAELVAILAIEVVPVKSFHDLITSHFFVLNDGHIPTTKYYLKGLQEQRQIPTFPENLTNADVETTIEKLLQSKSAMITVSDSFFPILATEGYSEILICKELSEVKVGSRPVKMSMFVKKGSPLKEFFNFKILLMSERGVKNRLMRSYIIDTSVQCLKYTSGFHTPQGIKDVFTSYAILIAGIGFSLSLAIAEKMFQKFMSRETITTYNEDGQWAS